MDTPHGSVAFVPHDLPAVTPLTPQIIRANDMALVALGQLGAIVPFLPNPELITAPFMRREAVLSSRIEGTNTEIEGLYLFETEERESPGALEDNPERQDAREVLNYVRALEFGIERLPKIPICNRLLKEMHEKLMERVASSRGKNKRPGQFRNVQAYIGEDILTARYVAPPEGVVDVAMAQFEGDLNRKNERIPALVKIAMLHYQFEAIHPFADGNGRLGRLLIALLLCSTGILPGPLLYISAYFERNRSQYYELLWRVSRCGAWTDWITFFLEGVSTEASDAVKRAKELCALREAYRLLPQTRRASAKTLELIDMLFNWPYVTVNRAAQGLKMSYPGAQKHVDNLVALGILKPIGQRVRNRLYYAREIVSIAH
ncbi:MAG TPA: Fic family protein [Pirellulales bacterium]|nr:Fic family protein [Pirellulales bacterium]